MVATREQLVREEHDRREDADHGDPQQRDAEPQVAAGEQAEADGRLKERHEDDADAARDQPQGQLVHRVFGQVFGRADAREELQRPEAEEDQAQANPEQGDARAQPDAGASQPAGRERVQTIQCGVETVHDSSFDVGATAGGHRFRMSIVGGEAPPRKRGRAATGIRDHDAGSSVTTTSPRMRGWRVQR